MPVLETPLSRESSTLPPVVADNLQQEKVPSANLPLLESLELRDEKLFERLEAWLSQAQAVVDTALTHHAHRNQAKKSTLQSVRSNRSVARAEGRAEEPRARQRPADHKELKVALGQTQALDEQAKGWRYMVRANVMSCLHNLATTASSVANTELNEQEARGNILRRGVARLVKTGQFEAFFAFVILSNSAFIAIQVQAAAEDPGAPLDSAFFLVGSVYTFLFTLELLLRAIGGGIWVFCGPDWAWLLMDAVVVASSLFEFVLHLTLQGNGNDPNVLTNMRLLRILRMGRIARAVRIVRLVRFITSLRQLLYSIGQTLRVMVWSVVLLTVVIFLFGLIFTDVASDHRSRSADSDSTAGFLASRFGGLEASMHSLYAAITGGFSWIEARDALAEISSVWGFLFEAYIAFCLFAVLNVMTGVFCQSAMESAEKDHELVLQSVVADKAKYLRAVRRLFSQLDENEDGGITKGEFEAATTDPALRAVFDALEINAADAWALFNQLDSDGDNDVSAEEFLEGCMLLKGPARSVDVMSIKRDLATVKQRLEQALRYIGTSSTDMQAFSQSLHGVS